MPDGSYNRIVVGEEEGAVLAVLAEISALQKTLSLKSKPVDVDHRVLLDARTAFRTCAVGELAALRLLDMATDPRLGRGITLVVWAAFKAHPELWHNPKIVMAFQALERGVSSDDRSILSLARPKAGTRANVLSGTSGMEISRLLPSSVRRRSPLSRGEDVPVLEEPPLPDPILDLFQANCRQVDAIRKQGIRPSLKAIVHALVFTHIFGSAEDRRALDPADPFLESKRRDALLKPLLAAVKPLIPVATPRTITGLLQIAGGDSAPVFMRHAAIAVCGLIFRAQTHLFDKAVDRDLRGLYAVRGGLLQSSIARLYRGLNRAGVLRYRDLLPARRGRTQSSLFDSGNPQNIGVPRRPKRNPRRDDNLIAAQR
jgi:hypothetical protein